MVRFISEFPEGKRLALSLVVCSEDDAAYLGQDYGHLMLGLIRSSGGKIRGES